MRNMKFKSKLSYGVVCLLFVAAIAFATPINAFAAFTDNLSISVNNIEAATYTIDVIDTKTETKVDVEFGLMQEECLNILQVFFKELRKKDKETI